MTFLSHICPTCASAFVISRPSQIFCSKTCWPEYYHIIMNNTRKCETCGIMFQPKDNDQYYCHTTCEPSTSAAENRARRRIEDMLMANIVPTISTGTFGALAELRVAAHLLARGYNVFRSLSPNCYCDIIAVYGDLILHVEVKVEQKNKFGFSPGDIRPGVTCVAVWNRQTDTVQYRHPSTREFMLIP